MRIAIKGNTSSWSTASLRDALRIGMQEPNNPYADRVHMLSVKFAKTKQGGPRLYELGRIPSMQLGWTAKILLPSGECSHDQLARVLRLLGQMTGRAPLGSYDMPDDLSKLPPPWTGLLDLREQDKVDVTQKRADARVAKVEHCRAKVAFWTKQEAKAKRLRAAWAKMLKTQERAATRSMLTRADLARIDEAFERAAE